MGTSTGKNNPMVHRKEDNRCKDLARLGHTGRHIHLQCADRAALSPYLPRVRPERSIQKEVGRGAVFGVRGRLVSCSLSGAVHTPASSQ